MVEATEKREEFTYKVDKGEKPEIILARCKQHVDSWKNLTADQIKITQMSGMSNVCYKVAIIDTSRMAIMPDALLYRKFVCAVIDKEVEAAIFESMSDQGLGPKLFFRNEQYRIEGFFHGRPLTMWEVRNPRMMQLVATAICEFNFNADAMGRVRALLPINPERLGADTGIEWAR